MEQRQRKLAKYCLVPQRAIIVLMGCLAIVNAYTMRICLNIAITEMAHPVNHTNVKGSCNYPDDAKKTYADKNTDVVYNWTQGEQGTILSSFYIGYLLSHVPGGVLSEYFGGKHVLGLGILLTALLTLITPPIIYATDGSVAVLIVIRIIMGIGEGPTYPALNAILGQWIPLRERSFCGSLVFAGAQVGSIVGFLGSGALMSFYGNWAVVFYVFGGVGVVWWICWTVLCFSNPKHSPYMGDKERDYLRRELATHHVDCERKKIPWKAIFTSVPLWALVAAQFGHDWGWFTVVTDLPKYMKEVLHFDIKSNGVYNSLPYLMMWIFAVSSGILCDWLIDRGSIAITPARKIFTAIGAMGPAVFMTLAVYAGCNRIAAVALFTTALALMGPYYSGMKVNALDLSPNFSGTLMALVNGIGSLAGILAPQLIGLIAVKHVFSEWQIVFWINFTILTVTSVIYVIWASGEEQPWNVVETVPRTEQEEEAPKT